MLVKNKSKFEFRSDERGSTAIMFALILVPAVLLSAGSVDYGRVLSEQARLQGAADAASIAASKMIDASQAQRQSVALSVFNANTSTDQGDDAAVVTANVSGDSVTVSATKKVRTPFLSLANISSIDAAASATAHGTTVGDLSTAQKACLLALDPASADGIHIQGSNQIKYTDCWAHTNSTLATAINGNSSSSSAVGLGHCAVGNWSDPHSSYSPKPKAGCAAVADPYANVSAYSANSYEAKFTLPTKAATCKANNLNLKKGTFALDPGRYCGGMTIMAGATVTLKPGVYYLDNGILDVKSGASLTGDDVLFYLQGTNSRFEIIGGGNVSLTGRQAGSTYEGFVLIAHPDANPMGESNIQGGGTFKLEGMLYAPKQRIEVSGNGDVNGGAVNFFGMVAKDFYFRGNGVFNLKKHGGGSLPDIMPMITPVQTRTTVLTN